MMNETNDDGIHDNNRGQDPPGSQHHQHGKANDPPGSQHYQYGKTQPASPSIAQSYSFAGTVGLAAASFMERRTTWEEDARPLLPKAAFFMGDLRDGLPMLNMQAVFLICSKNFTEKQIGILFLAFGLSQFICMVPVGYFLDYSNRKIDWVNCSGAVTALLTVATALTAQNGGENMGLMILLKVIQGGASAILPPGFNSVTLGIVGGTGFTVQVSKNRSMNHIGTALIVALGSAIAYILYPNIGALFVVSPLTMIGVYYNMVRIKPNHVDRDAARGLIVESPTMTEYEHMDTQSVGGYLPANTTSSSSDSSREENLHYEHDTSTKSYAAKSKEIVDLSNSQSLPYRPPSNESKGSSIPSFNFGWGGNRNDDQSQKPRTPLAVLRDPTLFVFTLVVFCFHMANSSVLPLVMQSLAVEDEKNGILLSGMCIVLGQAFMSMFAKICGDYSPKWGRKGLMLVALSSLTIRCIFLTILMALNDDDEPQMEAFIIKGLVVSTQLLDSIGAGIFGTMHILVTNDISSRSGRFSLMMGITSSAMCLGATVSGYIGQAIAEDYGYAMAFTWLGGLSLVPLLLYIFFMPETLPDYVKPQNQQRRLEALIKRVNQQRRKLFRRKHKKQVATLILESDSFDKQDGLIVSDTNHKTATIQLV